MGIKKLIKKNMSSINDWFKAEYFIFSRDIKEINLQKLSTGDNKIICLLAHYNKDSVIPEWLYHYIKELKKSGCDIVIIISSPIVKNSCKNKLLAHEIGFIHRNNIGYDFGSWRTAIKALPTIQKNYKTVLFANDSVYGPFTELSKIINNLENRNFDVWSLTNSLEIQPHLQSYFWAISNNGLQGSFFNFFWKKYYRYYSQRKTVINRYELKIKLIAEKQFYLKTGCYFDLEVFKNNEIYNTNPSKFNPLQHGAIDLLKTNSMPFIKRELLEKNPFNLSNIDQIKYLLKKKNYNLWEKVQKHL